MAERDELTPAELGRRFDLVIRPRLARLPLPAPGRQPVLVILGGQPGAGKTVAQHRARTELPNAGVVDADALRQSHPQFRQLMRTDPLRMPDATASAAGAWYRMSAQYLRETGRDAILETTLRKPSAVAEMIEPFREAGYRVELHVVAVPPALSRLGIVARYAQQLEAHGAGRWTPGWLHDEAVANSSLSVEQVVSEGLVDRALIVTREDEVLLDADIAGKSSGDLAPIGREVRHSLDAAWLPPSLSVEACRAWLSGLSDRARYCLAQAEQPPDLLPMLRHLVDDAQTVITQAYPDDPHAQRAAAAMVSDVGAAVQSVELRRAAFPLPAGTTRSGDRPAAAPPTSLGWERPGPEEGHSR